MSLNIALYFDMVSGVNNRDLKHETFKTFGHFPTKDMQIPRPLSFDPVYMNDAQYAETNENSNFPMFAIFGFWDIVDFVL